MKAAGGGMCLIHGSLRGFGPSQMCGNTGSFRSYRINGEGGVLLFMIILLNIQLSPIFSNVYGSKCGQFRVERHLINRATNQLIPQGC